MDGKMVIVAACNNGTSALVTREGELYIFGKDSTYCDSTNGNNSRFVCDNLLLHTWFRPTV